MAITNLQWWNALRDKQASFKSHTAEGTAELFTERGFDALMRNDINAINEFYLGTVRIYLQEVRAARAKNPLNDKGIVEVYETPNGGYVQRMIVNQIKPVSPRYKGLKNGASVDPYVVRKPEIGERFFQKNFDYQSFVTNQEFQAKTIFLEQYGIDMMLAGISAALESGYTKQEYFNTMECINAAINSKKFPLQDTQTVSVVFAQPQNPTNDELVSFILTIKDIATSFESIPSSAAYNAFKFDTLPDEHGLVLMTRAGLKNKIAVNLEVGAFNPDRLTIPYEIVEVQNFGGLIPYKEASYKTQLYPVYDEKFGDVIGFAENEGATEVTVKEDAVFYKDPNADVEAILIEKGAIFENTQNAYMVNPIFNPAGLYTNIWASRPNNGIVYDPARTLIVIKNK